jgi:hypothetical protein
MYLCVHSQIVSRPTFKRLFRYNVAAFVLRLLAQCMRCSLIVNMQHAAAAEKTRKKKHHAAALAAMHE